MRNIYFTITTILFLLWDILTKSIVENNLEERIQILGNFVYFEKVYNTGIAFSIALPSLVLKIMTLVLIFAIIVYYFYERKKTKFGWKDVWFSLIIGWAIGNGIERIFQWYVVDFIGVQYFAVFNLADTWICLWAMILGIIYWKESKIRHFEGTIVTEKSSW